MFLNEKKLASHVARLILKFFGWECVWDSFIVYNLCCMRSILQCIQNL